METTQAKTVKTTVNLKLSVKQRMEDLTKRKVIKSQTEFINGSLEKGLENMEKEIALRKLRQKLHNLKGYKSKMTVLEARDQVRAESMNYS